MDECIFCAIVARQAPAATVYEDDETLAFLDIYPVAEGHTLVILKAHMRATRIVANAFRAAGLAEGLNLLQSNELVGGQDIVHMHFHLIPREADDGIMTRPGRDRIFNWHVARAPSLDELIKTANVIRHAIVQSP